MASTLSVILEMLNLVISNTLETFVGIIGLFGKLLASLGLVAEVGGPLGFGVSLIIIAAISYFIAKIFFGGSKRLLLLIPIAIILSYIILLGTII